MRQIFVYIGLLLLTSCTSSDTKIEKGTGDSPHANAVDTIVTGKQPGAVSGCYQWISNKDSAFLTLVVSDSAVSGNLRYQFFEKDKNSGTLSGVIRGNLIRAHYRFMSEGVNSYREIVFKLEEGKLTEGSGEVFQKNDTMSFKSPEELSFDDGIVFNRVVCNR